MTTLINPNREIFQKKMLATAMLAEIGRYGMRLTRNVNPFTFAKQFYPITRRTKYDKFIQYIDFLFQDGLIDADQLKDYAKRAKQRLQED
jgi:hypothetical protein